MCTHVWKCKNDTTETLSGLGGQIKEGSGGGEFKYDIYDTL
jgi:hypothetical protein